MRAIMIMVVLVVEVEVEVDLRWFKFLDCSRAVSQKKVEHWGEDEVKKGDCGGSDQVKDGSKVW